MLSVLRCAGSPAHGRVRQVGNEKGLLVRAALWSARRLALRHVRCDRCGQQLREDTKVWKIFDCWHALKRRRIRFGIGIMPHREGPKKAIPHNSIDYRVTRHNPTFGIAP